MPLKSKQRPIQPKKPLLGTVVLGVAPGVTVCAEAKPIITKVRVAIATRAMTIFVLFICFITILRYMHRGLWQLVETNVKQLKKHS